MEESVRRYCGVVVEMPIKLFRKIEFETVEVDRSDPTVSCDVVAISDVPAESDVMIELAGNVPPRFESDRQVAEIA